MNQIKDNLTPDILYFFIYGDQHHKTNYEARQGRKIISDGGSNIHTNFLLRIKDKVRATIYTYKDNYQVKNFFSDCPSISVKEFSTLSSFFKKYLLKIEVLTRCFYPGLTFLFKKLDCQYLITQTDFLPDTFSAFCAKLRNPEMVWVASFFLTAPAPWGKDSPYKGKNWLIGFFYWLLQKPSLWFIRSKADKVLVTSRPDVVKFINSKRGEADVIIVQGGVDISRSEEYLNSRQTIPFSQKKYDACFVGRLHYQKGLIDLIDIWQIVCAKKPGARLALIGVGPLEKEVKEKIKDNNLEGSIDLLGLKDGEEKYQIFKQSKTMVHPATYDSGGMAAAEGMAWGLPAVSYDLESLKTYYPLGMVKSENGDRQDFANNILKLLNDQDYYNQIRDEALRLIREVWDWDKRADDTYNKLFR